MNLLFGKKVKALPNKLQTIKYIGSKNKIISYILHAIKKCENVNTILDGFAGSCRVSQSLSYNNYTLTCNDTASYSYTLANCFLLGRDSQKLRDIIESLDTIRGYHGWFSEHYGGSVKDTKKPFQYHNTKKLDGILAEIDKLQTNHEISKIEKHVLLTSLLIALDKVDSTLGHQSSYLKSWSERSYKTMQLTLPYFYNPYFLHHKVCQKDVFDIAEEYHDLAYYDPPYGSNNDKMPASRVRYKCYYHIWESIVKNDKPDTFGVNHRRIDTKDHFHTNPFEDFRKTNNRYNSDIAIEKLIAKTNAKYILFSYNSNGRTSLLTLKSILKKYFDIINTQIIPYRKNIMAYMNTNQNWQNELSNYEVLILGRRW